MCPSLALLVTHTSPAAIMHTNRSKTFIFVFLTVFAFSLFNVGGVTAKAGNASKVVNQAIKKGKTDFGGYSIDNITEKVNMRELKEYLESKNYVILNSVEDGNGNVESIQFVLKSDFVIAYFKMLSGGDATKTRKAKCCLFVDGHLASTFTPVLGEIYWSGEIVDGYVHGKGWGLNMGGLTTDKDGRAEGGFNCFEAEYYYGIPVSDVKSYHVDMNNLANYKNIKPRIYEKCDLKYYKYHKNKLEYTMFEHYLEYTQASK